MATKKNQASKKVRASNPKVVMAVGTAENGRKNYALTLTSISIAKDEIERLSEEKQFAINIASFIESGGDFSALTKYELFCVARSLRAYADLIPKKPSVGPGQKSQHNYQFYALKVAKLMVSQKMSKTKAYSAAITGVSDADAPSIEGLSKALNKPAKKGEDFTLLEAALFFVKAGVF